MAAGMVIHKIVGPVWSQKGERFESVNKQSAERKLDTVKKQIDPDARLLSIPVAR